MTAAREAIVLPLMFLTVFLAGGLRPGAPLVLPPPTLFALVLSVLLAGALVQSGAFDPRRLIGPQRSSLANANGVVVLASLFLAGAQVFSVLTPDSGLPRVILSVYFLVLMLNTIAAGPDRVRVLRSLGVTFGAAFILKFVVLDALSNPAAGRFGRALQLVFEGVTLSALTQEVRHAAAGYLAFVAVAIFLVGIWMLPERPSAGRREIPGGSGIALTVSEGTSTPRT
ncbi:MAG TPA: hypothetical protein VFP98_08170 [Candidatus Polarisedimenticolia bacterium]|nr:hypothetical protein [Candidatus Polarisedimenticolia bacterium]